MKTFGPIEESNGLMDGSFIVRITIDAPIVFGKAQIEITANSLFSFCSSRNAGLLEVSLKMATVYR